MKKLIGLLLSLAMVFTLSLGSTGCGGKDKDKKPADKTGTDAPKDTPPKDTPPKDTPPKDKKKDM